jgi:TonB-linked SusC/RagA family outer membrane protein
MKQFVLAMGTVILLSVSANATPHFRSNDAKKFFQTGPITGVVTNDKGEPLAGVSVQVKGLSTSVVTGADGAFSINAPAGSSTLVFTYVGMERREVSIAGKTNFQIQLKAVDNKMDEVVVVGYGAQRAKDVTGSVVTVDLKRIQDIPVATITEALRGQIPGVNVSGGSTRPGSMPFLTVRQQFDYSKDGGSPLPLIIIDDVIQVDPQSGKPSLDRFNLLDLSEVESITVLRDASAAIYGYRSSQGAIIVKTKRGKAGPPRISYSGKFETNDAISHGKVMNAYEYGVYANRFGRSAGWNNNNFFSAAELERMKSLNYDWLREDWKRANAMQHSLDVSGGSDRATFFTGASYYGQGANLGSQDFNKFNFRAGTDVKVASNLRLAATLAANNSNLEKSFTKVNVNDGSYGVGGEQNDYSMLLHMPSYIPWVYNIGGIDRYVSPALGPHRVGTVSGNNSVANSNYYALLNNGSKTTTKYFGYNANFSLQYDLPFIKGLSAKFNYAIASYSSNTEQVMMPVVLSLANNTNTADHHLYDSAVWNNPATNRSNSRVTYDNATGSTEQINFFLNYDHSFGDHNVSAMVSGERAKNTWEDRYQIYDNPIIGAYNGTSISAGTLNTGNTVTSRTESGNLSYLGRVSYNYRSKYLLQFIFRSDASNNFAPENYWGFFPGVSAGWVLSDESWFKDNVSWVNSLKLRASYGKTGSNNIKAWKWLQLYKAETDKGMGFGTNGGALTTGITPEVSPNRDAKWDETIQRNIGIDFSVLKSRLNVNLDRYFNTQSNMFTLMSGAIGVPISVGGAYAEENFASVKFWGTEVSATWRDRAGKFDYSIGMNFGTGNNKITKYFDQPFDYQSKITTGRREGQSTYSPAWGFRTWKQTSTGDGLLRTDADVDAYWAYLTDLAAKSGVAGAAPNYLGITNKINMKKGMLAYEDVGGALDAINQTYAGPNGTILEDQDYVELLSKKKNRSYGITTNLSVSWKGISLMAQIATSWGGMNKIDYLKQGTGSTQSMWAQPIYLNDMYDSTDNPNGKYPNLASFDNFKGTNSDFFMVSAFRCYVRTLSVGYSIPKSIISKAHIENARLFLSGNNLWDFYNPYPNKYRNMYDAPNVGYPTLRTWALGVNLGF